MPKVLDHLALIMSSTMRLLVTHINKTSVCTSFYGIPNHKPIFLSCNKVLSDGFRRPTKVFKWSTHSCKNKKFIYFTTQLFFQS